MVKYSVCKSTAKFDRITKKCQFVDDGMSVCVCASVIQSIEKKLLGSDSNRIIVITLVIGSLLFHCIFVFICIWLLLLLLHLLLV